MQGPEPSPAELETILALAARVPDHGKLAPWRFLVMRGSAREAAGRIALDLATADDPEIDELRARVEQQRFSHAPLVVAVISRAAPHAKIPEWEQVLSAGAACMNFIVAASALGYAATWLTGWYAYDARFRAALGLAEPERIAGFLHVGRVAANPEERVRPDMSMIVSEFAPAPRA